MENRYLFGETFEQGLIEAKTNLAANWPMIFRLYNFMGYDSIRPLPLAQFDINVLTDDKLPRTHKYLSLFNVKYFAATKPLHLQGFRLISHKYQYGLPLYYYENRQVMPRAYFLNEKLAPDRRIGQAEIVLYDYDRVSLKCRTKKASLLFLSDAYYPGWQATVDGKAEHIIRANDLFRAVAIPAGNHQVEFAYQPASFRWGMIISLLSAVALLVIHFKTR